MNGKGGIIPSAGRHISATIAAATFLLASLLFASCAKQPEANTKESNMSAQVRVSKLVPRTFVEYGRYYGDVSPAREATLRAVAGGRVDQVLAAPGDWVSAGQSLARINAERAQSQYDTAVLSEQVARRDYEVKTRLRSNGNASDVSVDQAHLAWLQSRTNLIDATKALEGARAISPIDGVVTARHIDQFDELTPGRTTFVVADVSHMKVTVGVPEADIAGVDRLCSAEIRLSSFPDRVWVGTPLSIARKRSDGSRSYEVELLVDNPDHMILSGTTATVTLGLRSLPNQIIVPTSALRSDGDETYVMVANSPTARKKAVKTGPSNLTETVVASGLSAGEELIVEGINRVRDGDRVAVRN